MQTQILILTPAARCGRDHTPSRIGAQVCESSSAGLRFRAFQSPQLSTSRRGLCGRERAPKRTKCLCLTPHPIPLSSGRTTHLGIPAHLSPQPFIAKAFHESALIRIVFKRHSLSPHVDNLSARDLDVRCRYCRERERRGSSFANEDASLFAGRQCLASV